jgi:hypothetical protein
MFSLLEIRGHSRQLHQSGTVEIHTDLYRKRRPAWLVLVKILGVTAMVAVGAAIAVPTLMELDFPLWHAALATGIGMIAYTAVAFFFRPEANTDNMGVGGGMVNDPFQCGDNVNRFLWKAHCVLGPGRFTAETFLDFLVLVRILKNGDEEIPAVADHAAFPAMSMGGAFDATKPIAPLDPTRFAQSSGNFVAGQIQLDTQRFLASASSSIPAPAGHTSP